MLGIKIDFLQVSNIYKEKFLNKEETTSFMQQVKQRVYNERIGHYNVAFNHLLNEFQNLVEAAYFNRKKQEALDIRNKLTKEKFKVSDILIVSDFFKRRNQNSISHTNDTELGFWGVDAKEYYKYKSKIEPLMQQILENIEKKEAIANVIALLKGIVEKR